MKSNPLNLIRLKNLLFASLLCLSSISVFSQKLILNNGKWNINEQTVQIKKDTSFNTLNYRLVELSLDSNKSFNTIGFIREDILTKKVYFLEKDSVNEKLIYDFSLKLGDSVIVYSRGYEPFKAGFNYLKVEKIDSVLINGIKTKQIHFKHRIYSMVTEFWIEGIGSSNGIIYSGIIDRIRLESTLPNLLCVEYGNDLIFKRFNFCYSKKQVGLNQLNKNDLNIYPNPNQGTFVLSVNDDSELNSIRVFDMTGKEFEFEKTDISTNKILINLSNITAGLYIIETIDTNGILKSFKFTKD